MKTKNAKPKRADLVAMLESCDSAMTRVLHGAFMGEAELREALRAIRDARDATRHTLAGRDWREDAVLVARVSRR